MQGTPPLTVLTLFGTRPEIIKLAPVIRALEESPERFHTPIEIGEGCPNFGKWFQQEGSRGAGDCT